MEQIVFGLVLVLLAHSGTAFKLLKGREPVDGVTIFTDQQITDTRDNQSDIDCVLTPSNQSKSQFRHRVYFENLNFVFLNISTGEGVSLDGGLKDVIEEHLWTWTFYGRDGALEFLNWPTDFQVWSMGLLNTYVDRLPVTLLRESGNCSHLTVGEVGVDRVVSEGLIQLVRGLIVISMAEAERYGPTFFCYRQRMYIQPRALYIFCKHIICPFEAVTYKCCSYAYVQSKGRRVIICNEENPNIQMKFHYDNLWWMGPIIFSVLVFFYLPLPLMNLASYLTPDNEKKDRANHANTDEHAAFVFYNGKCDTTLTKTLFSPLIKVYYKVDRYCSRLLRACLPILSISIIGLQIYLDSVYLKQHVLDSAAKGTPMGFRSMLAGYEGSRLNFLPYLGGPFVALAIYVVIAAILCALPCSLSGHLQSGLPDSDSTPCSPLVLNLKLKERLGSLSIQGKYGFRKVANVSLAQFYMLLNKDYWVYAIEIQILRFKSYCKYKISLIILPLYIALCIFEHILCLWLYGMPVIFFSLVLFRSYYKLILRIQPFQRLNGCSVIGICLLMTFLIASLTMFLFMLFTIFLDACLFVTRLFIFTFTGLVIYPKNSYGYLIFALTAVYYLVECFKNFSNTYKRMLWVTIKVCKRLQRANDQERLVVRQGLFLGVRSHVFDHVIERLRPRRKEVFSCLLRLCLVLGAISVSLLLLAKTDKFRELNVLVHVSTVLLTCAVPKLVETMLGRHDDSMAVKKLEQKIENVVLELLTKPLSVSDDFSDSNEVCYMET